MTTTGAAVTGLRTSDQRYTIAVIDGPNVSNLARRSKRMYGPNASAEGLGKFVLEWGGRLGVDVERFLSNHEGAILEYIHESSDRVDGYLVNPAGLTTTSHSVPFALYDTGRPVVEVHFANISASAATARGPVIGPGVSTFTPLVSGQVMGMREYSYAGALLSLVLALDDVTFFGADPE
ncbi:3-dehydroquinate dehydratase-2 [Amycolatopsis bartoniae]|uniref:3-dehydroquinate dehydratase n=1 Tax=Amycolatopsis bartoniae TaxID=941986 RepID=A0A8H9IVX8_9PSEU|nr:type II 3-dehydroquinate dehydratase [Amycolatopsis bartoniae]MBB2936581.1 3-dehydroquinate dehydratase-2 [Amycolatopsis bartoniae]GHF67906.1 dehydroquinase [Amycolatopsis bartoniae]